MSKKILVTGGTGYIGSHTVVELQQLGYNVVIVDNLSNSERSILNQIEKITGVKPEFHELDLCDEKATSEFLKGQKDIQAVIHFAAFKAVGESVEQPLKYYRNNIFSLVNLLNGMKENSINNIVFSSSCTVYGQPEKLPVNESSPLQVANSPYGNTKQISEEILKDTIASGELNCVSLRYFNPIGAHPSAMIGELPNGVPNNLVPFITQTAIGKRDFLRVFGNDYDTADGYCVRDYIHVVDLAKAHVVSIERLLNKKQKQSFEMFNVGTGEGYSVMQAIKVFEEVSGEKLNYKVVERRPGDVVEIYADTKLANEELGWKAQLGLHEMMSSAWNWEKNLNEEILKK